MGLKKEIADKTSNQVSFKEIYTLNIDGKRVVMFHIPAAPQGIPVAFEGHYYAREHESLVPLGIEKIERIRKQNHEPYSRAEKREKDQKHWIEI
jgi:ATP-dependent DNA helicase RecG